MQEPSGSGHSGLPMQSQRSQGGLGTEGSGTEKPGEADRQTDKQTDNPLKGLYSPFKGNIRESKGKSLKCYEHKVSTVGCKVHTCR